MIGVTAGYHGWTEFSNARMELGKGKRLNKILGITFRFLFVGHSRSFVYILYYPTAGNKLGQGNIDAKAVCTL